MAEYRWNQSELAAAYDADAMRVHPHYAEVQGAILTELEAAGATDGLIVDLGGGSGRLIERILDCLPRTRGAVVDQSQAFLDIARKRLERFSDRVSLHCLRLQDDWQDALPEPATAVVSTSAIHHLEPDEKQACYQRCFEALRPGGVLLNGDEVRSESADEYRGHVEKWAAHMKELIRTEAVSPAMAGALQGWVQRNVEQFGQPRVSGDDCHETAEAQLGYFSAAGFTETGTGWHKDLWTVLRGRRPRE